MAGSPANFTHLTGFADVIQIREVAAQALSSLISPEDALEQAAGRILFPALWSPSLSLNAIHGKLLVLRHLIAEVINWVDVTAQNRRQIEGILLDSLTRHSIDSQCPVIVTAVLECVVAYLKWTRPTSTTLVDASIAIAKTALSSQQKPQPGRALLVEACTNLLMAQDSATYNIVDLITSAQSEDQILIALKNLPSNPERLNTSVFIEVVDRAANQKGSNALQIAALQVLIACPWSQEVTECVGSIRRKEICKQLQYTILNTNCVPLKEALLPALGCFSSWVRSCITKNILSNTERIHSGRQAALEKKDSSTRCLWLLTKTW